MNYHSEIVHVAFILCQRNNYLQLLSPLAIATNINQILLFLIPIDVFNRNIGACSRIITTGSVFYTPQQNYIYLAVH